MASPLVRLASYTTGISTPHYLYFNEAVSHLLSAGTAPQVAHDLRKIQAHTRIARSCQFPAGEPPHDLLARMTQSSSYHLAIAANPAVVTQIVGCLSHASGVTPAESLALSPLPEDQAALFDLQSFDLSRGIRQLYSSLDCYVRYAKLQTPKDALADLMDVCLPALHCVTGALMFLGKLQFHHAHGSATQEDTLAWFQFTEGLMHMLSGIYDWMTPKIHSTAIAHTLKPEEPVEVLQGQEAALLTTTLAGIQHGLHSLGLNLLAWSGDEIRQFGMQILQLEREQSQSLLDRFDAIANKEPYQSN